MTVARFALGALVAASLAMPATAQDLRFGVQAHASLPMGDLKDAVDSKAGIGVGLHLTVDFGQGHVLRPRLDYVAFPDATVYSVKNRVNDLSLGADYLYMIEGRTGCYVLGGLSANRWKFDAEVGGLSFSTSTTKLGYALGTGYAFNENVSLELRFTATKFDSSTVSNQNANALQLAALYRF